MADPVTILSIVNGSLGLALKIGKVAKQLYEINKQLKGAELSVLSIATECETIEAAWGGIERWASSQQVADGVLLEKLSHSLMVGMMVMSTFEEDLLLLSQDSGSSWGLRRKGKFVWKGSLFERHQAAIRGQVAATSLLLQIELLQREESVLKTSDESAWTIVGSRASTIVEDTESRRSIDSIYVGNSARPFEDTLYTTRVYKRSYRNLVLRKIVSQRSKKKRFPGEDPQVGLQNTKDGPNTSTPGEEIVDTDFTVTMESTTKPTLPEFIPKVLNIKSATSGLEAIRGFHFPKAHNWIRQQRLKVVLLGDGHSGKTALAVRYCYGFYGERHDSYDPTIEDTHCKYIEGGGQIFLLEVVDLAGQDEYLRFHEERIVEADAFVLCYSIASRSSFYRVHGLYTQISLLKVTELAKCPIVIVGTKRDLITQREVSTQEGYHLARKLTSIRQLHHQLPATQLECNFFELSAKDNVNVDEVFDQVVANFQDYKQNE